MAPLSPRKLPLSPCLTPPPVGLSPRSACSCNRRCPVHLVSVNEMDQRSLNGNTPPPSLVTDSDADSNKENVPIYPAVNIAAAAV